MTRLSHICCWYSLPSLSTVSVSVVSSAVPSVVDGLGWERNLEKVFLFLFLSDFLFSPAASFSALTPAVPLLTLGSPAGGGVAPCPLLSVRVTPVPTRARPRLRPAPVPPRHVLVPVLPGHRGPGVSPVHRPPNHSGTLAPVGHDCHQVTALDLTKFDFQVRTNHKLTNKDSHTSLEIRTPFGVLNTHSTALPATPPGVVGTWWQPACLGDLCACVPVCGLLWDWWGLCRLAVRPRAPPPAHRWPNRPDQDWETTGELGRHQTLTAPESSGRHGRTWGPREEPA